MRNLIAALVILVLFGILADAVLFIIDEREQVVVTRLGEPKRTIVEPGLNWKAPFVEQVHSFDRRLLFSDADPAPIYTQDKKNLIVDNFARWKIVDPLKFLRSVQTIFGAQSRLDDIIYAAVREELGKRTLEEIVSGERDQIMTAVTDRSRTDAADLGIEVVDVRIKRADLPEENKKNVFDRMRAERARQAKEYRAEGEEVALKIKAETDLEVTRIQSNAFQKAQFIRGQGDAEALKIYADAFQQDPKFYEFQRTLEAYEKTLGQGTTVVLPLGTDFFKYLGQSKK
ncbi:MAG TPA: protease modulator HflC [Candidatus Latescibacteria bacterium]|jgi:membrane protease subunit HflC|nr:protease modulator HflC [Candidatus Latescibacterota bacterium]